MKTGLVRVGVLCVPIAWPGVASAQAPRFERIEWSDTLIAPGVSVLWQGSLDQAGAAEQSATGCVPGLGCGESRTRFEMGEPGLITSPRVVGVRAWSAATNQSWITPNFAEAPAEFDAMLSRRGDIHYVLEWTASAEVTPFSSFLWRVEIGGRRFDSLSGRAEGVLLHADRVRVAGAATVLSYRQGEGGAAGAASVSVVMRLRFADRPFACGADFNSDGFVDFFDFDEFVIAFESGDPRADFNRDGFTDFFDFDEFTQAFEAGC